MRIEVHSQFGVESARREAREIASTLGFGVDDAERIVLATAELATNLVRYAHSGEIVLEIVTDQVKGTALEIESHDVGPGIADLERALQEGFSTSGGLGAGLASVRRLMDDFTASSGSDGTHIVTRKWLSKAR